MAKKKTTQDKPKRREIWRTLSGYEPAYQLKVSNRGRVTIVPEVKQDDDGRKFVTLAGRDVPIDLLVAQAFIPNPTYSQVPIHINGDMSDNDADNIRWLRHGKDEDVPQRIFSTLSLLTYILHPNLLADRDKEFTKFYTYIEYLWRSGQMPIEEEQLILDGYDEHRKRTQETWINETLVKNSAYKEAAKVSNPHEPSNPDINPISVPHPYTHIPKDILASALIDLYDRAMSQQDFQRATVQTNLKTLLPELIHGAIRRVVNQGGPQKTLTKAFNIEHPSIWSTSKDSGTVYTNHKNNMFEMALWATDTDRRLNMVSPLPKLNKGHIPRTKHIQSLLYETLKNCRLPEWAQKEILQDITPEMIEKYKDLTQELGLQETHIDITEETDVPAIKPVQQDPVSEQPTNQSVKEVSHPCPQLQQTDSGDSNKTTVQQVSYEDMYADAVITSVKPLQKPDNSNTDTTSSDNDATEKIEEVSQPHRQTQLQSEKPRQLQPSTTDEQSSGQPTFAGHSPVYSPDQPYLKPNQRTYATGVNPAVKPDVPSPRTEYKPGDGPISEDIELDAPYYRYKRDGGGFPIHYARTKVFTEEEKDLYRLPRDINTTPEFDELGRPLYDEHLNLIVYNDSLPIPVNDIASIERPYVHRTAAYEDKKHQARKLAEYMASDATTRHPDHRKDAETSNPDYVSPLYVKERDLTLGYINAYAGREASAFYNRQGYKVYHNVPYGEKYDPEIHTLFIPELYEFPPLFNAKNRKRSYLTEYAEYLMKRHPEITDPEIFKKYYETAKAAKELTAAIPNSAKDVMWKHNGHGTPVRGWMPDGECLVFDSIKEAERATGCSARMVKECAEGRRIESYGIRWEYVDLCDMDTMINRYIKRVMEACESADIDIDWKQYMTDEALERMSSAVKSQTQIQREEKAQNRRDRKEYQEYKEYQETEKKKRRNLERGKFSTDIDDIADKEIGEAFYTGSDYKNKKENTARPVTAIIGNEPVEEMTGFDSDIEEDTSDGFDFLSDEEYADSGDADDIEETDEDDGETDDVSGNEEKKRRRRLSPYSRWKDYVPYFERDRQKPDDFVFEKYDISDKPWLDEKYLYEDTDEWATDCIEPVWDESIFDPDIPESELIEDESTGHMIRRRKERKLEQVENFAAYKEMQQRVMGALDNIMDISPGSDDSSDISPSDEMTVDIEDEILVPEEDREGYVAPRKRGRPKKNANDIKDK